MIRKPVTHSRTAVFWGSGSRLMGRAALPTPWSDHLTAQERAAGNSAGGAQGAARTRTMRSSLCPNQLACGWADESEKIPRPRFLPKSKPFDRPSPRRTLTSSAARVLQPLAVPAVGVAARGARGPRCGPPCTAAAPHGPRARPCPCPAPLAPSHSQGRGRRGASRAQGAHVAPAAGTSSTGQRHGNRACSCCAPPVPAAPPPPSTPLGPPRPQHHRPPQAATARAALSATPTSTDSGSSARAPPGRAEARPHAHLQAAGRVVQKAGI